MARAHPAPLRRKVVSIWFKDDEMLDKIRAAAERLGVPVSSFIRHAAQIRAAEIASGRLRNGKPMRAAR